MQNKILVSGKILTEPVLEESFGTEKIYGVQLGVKKPAKDEYYDIHLRVSNRFSCFKDLKLGCFVEVQGSLRSTNKKAHTKDINNRFLVSIFCSAISIIDDFIESANEGTLEGVIINTPFFAKATDKMPQRCDVMLSVERDYNKFTYLPVTFRGRNAEYIAGMPKGTGIHCVGRIQSREYTRRTDVEPKPIKVTEFVAREVDVFESRHA